MIAQKSLEAISIDLSKSTFITRKKKTIKVDRVMSVQERKADEIGKRPPYAYTSACPNDEYKR